MMRESLYNLRESKLLEVRHDLLTELDRDPSSMYLVEYSAL